jgi:hypothetical protein
MRSPPTDDAAPRWRLGLALCALLLAACGAHPSVATHDATQAAEDADLTPPDAADQGSVSASLVDAQTSTDSETSSDSEAAADGVSDVEDASSVASYPLDDVLRLNHMQVKGTHNSYHQEPSLVFHESHGYSHPPLDEQMEVHGVRAFEIDVHLENGVVTVYHILFIDEETSCGTFTQCLEVIKGWSDVNLGHVPIMVWIEVKEDTGGGAFNDLTILDDLIHDVFPSERLLTPDDVRGEHASLRDALEDEGWPTLGEVRSRAMFMVLNGGSGVDAYTFEGQSSEGRTMFMGAGPETFNAPWAAVAKINDPGSSHVPEAHAKNILVASNGCGAGDDAADCAARLETALASGVQMYKDDFLQPTDDMSYWLDFPDGNPARCNAVTAPSECTSEALESL